VHVHINETQTAETPIQCHQCKCRAVCAVLKRMVKQ